MVRIIINKPFGGAAGGGGRLSIGFMIVIYAVGVITGSVFLTLRDSTTTTTGSSSSTRWVVTTSSTSSGSSGSSTISSSNSTSGSTHGQQQQQHLFDFPPTVKDVFINIGSNLDPIVPDVANGWGPCARTIAVEPVVGCGIEAHPQVSVLHAAVAPVPGLLSMKMYNNNGESSSLAAPAETGFWNNNAERGDGKLVLVPVIQLSTLLYAIPASTKIRMLMTDMQGFDFAAIQEAAVALKELVTHIVTEVWLDDTYTYAAENDLCRDFLPFFTTLGYTLVKVDPNADLNPKLDRVEINDITTRCQTQLSKPRPSYKDSPGLKESNAYWVRNDVLDTQPFPKWTHLPHYKPTFSARDYHQCSF